MSVPPAIAAPLAATMAARAYQSANDEDALVEQHLALAKTTVDRMRIYLPATLDLEDLYSVGVTGLMTAARKFDPSRNTSFSAFASLHIRGAVHDELRRMDWLPRSLRDKAKHFQQSISKLEQKLGRPAREDEICRELSLTAAEYDALLEEIKPASFVPLDNEAYSEDSDAIALHEIIPDASQEDASAELEKKDLVQVVVQRLQELPEMQRKVLAMYYFEEMRLAEIAAALGLTEGRISQIHTQAVQGLRAFMQRRLKSGEESAKGRA
ncbi:MAG: FliA/WhiG family RNA polymerase sigma factor [Chthoniobacteraceae bacterium]